MEGSSSVKNSVETDNDVDVGLRRSKNKRACAQAKGCCTKEETFTDG